MIDVVILTSSKDSVAAHHLPFLLDSKMITIKMVIVSQGLIKNKKLYYKRKWKKILKIGLLGTINGIRMRKWYNEGVKPYHQSISLDQLCKEKCIPYHETEYTNSEQTAQLFKKSNAEVGLSLGNGYIGKNIFSIPKYGMINIHHEILPDYQNAQSVLWQIYNGSIHSGFTIHKIDSKIDTGEIIYKENVPILFNKLISKTVSQTVAKIEDSSAKALVTILENFEESFNNSTQQTKGTHYTTPSILQYLKIVKQHRKLAKLPT